MSTLESLQRSSSQHRIVYECLYAYDHQHRDDRDNVSYTREQNVWHCIAPSYALAKAAWRHHYPAHVNYELVSCIPICTVDRELTI